MRADGAIDAMTLSTKNVAPPSDRGPDASMVRRLWRRLRRDPTYRWLRLPLGLILVLAGLVGFLPVVGFWMIPLGVSLLAIDIPVVRRVWRRIIVHVGRRWLGRQNARERNGGANRTQR
jgi:hypothetical protein